MLTSVIVDSSFDSDARSAIIGDYDKAQAKPLADRADAS